MSWSRTLHFRRISLSSVVLAGALATGASGQTQGVCFDADLGPWSPIEGTHTQTGEPAGPPSESLDSLFYSFLPRVMLTGADFSSAPDDWFGVEVPAGALSVPKPFRSWRRAGDSLWIRLSDGFTGTNSAMARTGDGWVGILRASSDNGGVQLYQRSIELRPADCRSPPPALASDDVPAPHSIPSGSGGDLVLERPVPEEYRLVAVRSMHQVVGIDPTGYWAGAETVLVRLNADDLVAEIHVGYPEGFDGATLRDGLLGDFGIGARGLSGPSWWNRSTRTFLSVEGRVAVQMIAPRLRP
jgi:hypothetical protein